MTKSYEIRYDLVSRIVEVDRAYVFNKFFIYVNRIGGRPEKFGCIFFSIEAHAKNETRQGFGGKNFHNFTIQRNRR